MNQKIAFLGCGNMGSAIISALLEKEVVAPQDLSICDRNAHKLETFASQGVHVSQVPEEVIENANIVFLAIKPQGAEQMLTMLRGSFLPGAILVSLAAGISAHQLQEYSGLSKIVRTLPNTPALVHRGVTEMYISEVVSAEESDSVQKLFQSFGTVVLCDTEEKLDAYGTISGCGPAYFFRILEIFSVRAEEFGLCPEEAQKLALHTMLGSAELANESGESFSVLREKVTSKGGITERALKTFDEKGLEEVLNAGIDAALRRTKELGK